MNRNAIHQYFETVMAMLSDVLDSQADRMEAVARAVQDSLVQGGMLYVFGTGHAHMIAEEMFYRAGGLVRVCAILEEDLMLHRSASGSTQKERQNGLAEEILSHYPVRQGDVLMIASNSGRNAVPVEMALLGKERGMRVIALTSLRHSRSAPANNRHGRRLFEVADLVIDTMGQVGDACVALADGRKMGAASTVVGAAIAQAIAVRAGELALEHGMLLETFASSNVPGGDEINKRFIDAYQGQIPGL